VLRTVGFDITNKTKMARAWPTISNEEIIDVNQRWHGHPGRLVRTWTPVPTEHPCAAGSTQCAVMAVAPPVDARGWAVPAAGSSAGGMVKHIASGLCLVGGEPQQQQVVLSKCDTSAATQVWVHDVSGELHLRTQDKVRTSVPTIVCTFPCFQIRLQYNMKSTI
jgi:hypothetical protein